MWTGARIGHVTVLGPARRVPGSGPVWSVACACGETGVLSERDLRCPDPDCGGVLHWPAGRLIAAAMGALGRALQAVLALIGTP